MTVECPYLKKAKKNESPPFICSATGKSLRETDFGPVRTLECPVKIYTTSECESAMGMSKRLLVYYESDKKKLDNSI